VHGHLQVITFNNIRERTYTQLISGGPVCGAGFWCRILAWHGEYCCCFGDVYVAVNGFFLFFFFFFFFLSGAVQAEEEEEEDEKKKKKEEKKKKKKKIH
jgi:hypothetical protein